MTAPLVTICFPTIGRMEYLADALNSLRAQTYSNCEVLILDNASGADAQRVLAEYVASVPNARLLRVEQRVPMFTNFNRGINAARGKYVVFFHDDDVYLPTFLDRHVALLEANPRAAFAAGNFDVVDGAGRQTGRHRGIRITGTWDGRFFIERLCRRGKTDLPTPGLVFRREALPPAGFDENLPINWGDFTVLMRMAERWEVAVLRDTLYSWRVHGRNSSNIALSAAIPMRTSVLLDYCREYTERHPGDEAFVHRLEWHVRRGVFRSLIWGWVAAPDAEEGRACRLLLQGSSHSLTASVLRALEFVGVTVSCRRAVLPAARYVARLMNV